MVAPGPVTAAIWQMTSLARQEGVKKYELIEIIVKSMPMGDSAGVSAENGAGPAATAHHVRGLIARDQTIAHRNRWPGKDGQDPRRNH